MRERERERERKRERERERERTNLKHTLPILNKYLPYGKLSVYDRRDQIILS